MTIYNLGNIKGEKGDKGDSVTGPTGPVGVGIKSIEQITYMKFKFCLTDGSEYIINYGDEPTFDDITVTSTNDILSYADGDSTVLSAQLTNGGQPVGVSGESVTFEVRKVSDDSLVETLTDTTDNTGLASVEYFGKGVGDLSIKCQCRSVIERYNCIILSKTYSIEDCYKANLSASYTFGSSDSKYKIFELPNNYTAYEIEGNLKSTVNNRFSVGLKVDNDNSSNSMVRIGTYTTIEAVIIASNGDIIARDLNGNYTANTDMKVRFVFDNGNFKLYANDTLRVDANVPFNPIHLMLHSYSSSKTVSVSDMKIKPL